MTFQTETSCVYCQRVETIPFGQKRIVIILTLLATTVPATYCLVRQSKGVHLKTQLRVQFNDNQLVEKKYDGCYLSQRKINKFDHHYLFNHFRNNSDATFGYCKKEHRWILFQHASNYTVCSAYEKKKRKR